MNDTIPAQAAGDNSLVPGSDQNENLDELMDAAALAFLTGDGQEEPVAEAPQLEVSEDEQSSDDEGIVSENEDESEEVEEESLTEEEEAVELPMVEEEDLKSVLFPTPDGPKTWNQLQRELGQVRAASKAQTEVNIQLEQVKSQQAQLDREYETLRQHQAAAGTMQQLGQQQAEIQRIEAELQQAREDGDFIGREDARDRLEMAKQKFDGMQKEVSASMQQLQQRNQAEQAAILEQKGFGDILTDDQRAKALETYIGQNASQQAMQAADIDASIAIAFEKARLYDKAQSASKKGRLRASSKTMKTGSGKIATQQQKQTQDLRQRAASGNITTEEADQYFENLANDMIFGQAS